MNDNRLDELLAAYRATEPSASLRARVIGGAPRQRAIGRARRWFGGAGVGLALAASCAGGVAAGFTLVPASLAGLLSGQHAPAASMETSSLADPTDDDAASG